MPRGADGLSPLQSVVVVLRQERIPFAVIGAAAMAVHGVTRGTRDLDLLTTHRACLTPELWATLGVAGIEVRVRKADEADPLAGVVRFTLAGEHPIDLIVGKAPWQARILEQAREVVIEEVLVPVADRAGLILLKLYVGGPQDAWDIDQLLTGIDPRPVIAGVESVLPQLPPESRRLWRRIRGDGEAAE